MKKKYLIGMLCFFNGILLFPQSETWNSIGFEFGNLFQNISHNGNETNIFMGSPGLNFYYYEFSNFRNIGFYTRQSILFRGIIKTDGNRDYDTIMHTSTVIGPGFRKKINEKTYLKFAFGMSYMLSSTVYNHNDSIDNTTSEHNLGVGGDVGIKYDIKDGTFVSMGLLTTYYFFNRTSVTRTSSSAYYGHDSYWTDRYSMVGIRPYLNIGFNYYRANVTNGKPK
ncbi:MAG: hypothetical protein LBI06_04825 [Treponema sp.]|nr:hypothetical protein [Treponema sp.]